MLTAQAKEDFKQFIERIISYAVVTVNGKGKNYFLCGCDGQRESGKESHTPQGKAF